MNILVDDLEYVVASMRNNALIDDLFEPSLKGKIPFFMYGHKLDIARRLSMKDADAVYKYEKFPLIALLMDFPEQVGNGMIHYTANIGILHLTSSEYIIEDRYSKVFKPVLYPLYQQFLKQLRSVGQFSWAGEQQYPDHTKWDRPFWGKSAEQGNDGYIFTDKLDAIEITDLKINKRIKTC